MSQHYSDPARESDPHALPDVETWQSYYRDCPECGAMVCTDRQTDSWACAECGLLGKGSTSDPRGWFYWYCFPGCLPDGGPNGPFTSEAEAIAEARLDS